MEAYQHSFQDIERYLSYGWSIIPVNKNKKSIVKWTPYRDKQPTAEDIFQWVTEYDPQYWAVITGKQSNLTVVDFDSEEVYSKFTEEYGHINTPTAKTSRGYHLYFKGNTTSKRNAKPNIDIVGTTSPGYAVLPNGKERLWLKSPDQYPLMELPSFVVEWKKRKRDKPQPSTVGSASKEYKYTLLCIKNKNTVLRIMDRMNIEADIGESFCCILPGHEEKNPSASIYKGDNGNYVYMDFHEKDDCPVYTLPEVYASQFYKRAVKLTNHKPEHVTWTSRLLIDSGSIERPDIPYREIAEKAPKSVHKVYEGFNLLLACKKAHTGSMEPTMFARDFAAVWCGVGKATVARSLKWLLDHGYIKKDGEFSAKDSPFKANLYTID